MYTVVIKFEMSTILHLEKMPRYYCNNDFYVIIFLLCCGIKDVLSFKCGSC
jgi:hypothetical protein